VHGILKSLDIGKFKHSLEKKKKVRERNRFKQSFAIF
jgi:hypothetical protein